MTAVRTSEITWSYPDVPALDLNGPTNPFRPFPGDFADRSALELFRMAAEEFQDRVACADLAQQLTYAQVWRACRRLGATIETITPSGTPVGILLPNEAAYAVAVLACLAANRPCVMIDRHHPEDRVAAIVRDAGLGAIILRQPDIAAGLLLPAGIRTIVLDEALEDGPVTEQLPSFSRSPGDARFIVYTSGSTGQPKGIVLGQRAVLHRARQLVNSVHLGPDDTVLSLASPSTIGGLQQIFEVMLAGATLVKLDLQRTGLGEVVRTIGERQISMMFSTPAVWRSVARIDGVASHLGSLRCIQSSGDALLGIDLEQVRQLLPADCHVLTVYGATEAPALLQWFVPPAFVEEGPRVPTGYPLDGFAFALLDDTGNAVKDGEPGELVVKGPWMSLGIWRQGAVHPDPFEHEARDPSVPVYRTGDLAYRRRDGLYVTLGRRDRQVKIRGNRVEIAEIEAVLRQMTAVSDAAVVARRIDGEPRLFAFVVPHEPASATFINLVRAHLKERLPAYMQPAQCFAIDALPLLPGRKIDEEALLGHVPDLALAAPAPSPAMPAARASQRSMDLVARAWRRACGQTPPEDGRSFNEAGGDSLRLLLLVLHLEQACGQALPLDQFSAELSPIGFALALDRCLAGPSPADADGRPLAFFIPGRRGDSPQFARFRTACAKGIRIQTIAYPDLYHLARGSFEDIVAHAAAQIEQVAPIGPIVLVGYSMGGDVAYGVAERLLNRDRKIGGLLILDTTAEDFSAKRESDGPRRLRQRLATLFRLIKAGDWQTIVEAILTPAAVMRPIPQYTLRFLSLFKLPVHNNFSFYVRWHVRAMLAEAQRTAWFRRVPVTRLDAPVILFRAEDSSGDLGWRARARSVTIVPVAGDHLSMLDPENSADLIAEIIRAVHTTAGRASARGDA